MGCGELCVGDRADCCCMKNPPNVVLEQDWSAYLIQAESLMREATDDLNRKDWTSADDRLAAIIHNVRMARYWLVKCN